MFYLRPLPAASFSAWPCGVQGSVDRAPDSHLAQRESKRKDDLAGFSESVSPR